MYKEIKKIDYITKKINKQIEYLKIRYSFSDETRMWHNIEFIEENPFALYFSTDEIINDESYVLTAVKSNGLALKYAGEELKNNKKNSFRSSISKYKCFIFCRR